MKAVLQAEGPRFEPVCSHSVTSSSRRGFLLEVRSENKENAKLFLNIFNTPDGSKEEAVNNYHVL